VRVEFDDPQLEVLFFDPAALHPRLSRELVRAYRKVVGLLREVADDQELRGFKALRLEKLKGRRQGQWSLRLTEGDRLIIRFRTEADGRVVVVVEIINHDQY
jgi:proteic killer suppression protein